MFKLIRKWCSKLVSATVAPSVVLACYTVSSSGSENLSVNVSGSLSWETIVLLEVDVENVKRKFFMKFYPRGDLWDELTVFIYRKCWEKYPPGDHDIDESEFYANIKCD